MTHETISKPAPPSNRQYVNFGVILYPDRIEHQNMIQYLENHAFLFPHVRILHDRDVWDEKGIQELISRKADPDDEFDGDIPNVGDPKEPHYHVAIHCKNKMTLKAFLKFYGVWIKRAEPLNNITSYILYMLHDTPDSMGKAQYLSDELLGDSKLIRSSVQNSHFVQLRDVLSVLTESDGSVYSLLSEVVNSEREDLLDCIKSYQSLICTMSNQEFTRKRTYFFQEVNQSNSIQSL